MHAGRRRNHAFPPRRTLGEHWGTGEHELRGKLARLACDKLHISGVTQFWGVPPPERVRVFRSILASRLRTWAGACASGLSWRALWGRKGGENRGTDGGGDREERKEAEEAIKDLGEHREYRH
ncbi:hypothetical protein MRX96_051559 [Rhipicephalus microplus]